jgi:hypothetical protein
MKSISGPVAAAAVAAALISFTASAAQARTVQHGGYHGGGFSIPYIGHIPYLGSFRHGSIPNLASLRNGSIPHLGSHLGSLRRFGSMRDLGSLRNLGSIGSLGSLGGGGRDPGAAYE